MAVVSGKLRRLIDRWVKGEGPAIKTMGEGLVFILPSSSERGKFYIVVRMRGGRWLCNCKSVRFNSRWDGGCSHIDDSETRYTRLLERGVIEG